MTRTHGFFRCNITAVLYALAIAFGLFSTQIAAQIAAGPGYSIKQVAGDNALGEYFAFTRGTGDARVGFHYLADRQALYSGSCNGGLCTLGTQLTSTGDRGQFVSAAVLPGAQNRTLVAYYDATAGDLRAGLCNSAASCSFFSAERMLDGGGDVGQHATIAVNPATGFAVIAYYSNTLGDARLYACSNADCSAGAAQTIETSGNVGRDIAIAFGANLGSVTNLFAVYTESTLGEVRYTRGNAPFSTFSAITLDQGRDPAISINVSGFPDVVYRGAQDTLIYLRCLSFECTLANRVSQTIASAGKGFAPSITRLPNGNAFVTAQEPSTGTLFGYVCNSVNCSNPQVISMESGGVGGAILGGTSIASTYADGRPLAFYRDATRQDVRTAECTSTACSAITSRISINGIAAKLPNFAIAPDGRVSSIWLSERTPIIGACSDAACTTVTPRATSGANSDARPAIAIRPDGRPFAYYASVGGTAAWDCADTSCSTGAERFVSGSGNSTSESVALALRSDGVPVMQYYRNSTKEVFVFVCADNNCNTGTERLLLTEPTANTFLSSFSVHVGSDNRAIVSYIRFNSASSIFERRYVRCVDAACSSATAITLATSPQSLSNQGAALQSNGFLAFPETQNLIRCADLACSTVTSTPLPFSPSESSSLRFAPGNVAVFDYAAPAAGGFRVCADVNCATANLTGVISSSPSEASFIGKLALNATSQPLLVFDETQAEDIWLAIPTADGVFKNGFEQ